MCHDYKVRPCRAEISEHEGELIERPTYREATARKRMYGTTHSPGGT